MGKLSVHLRSVSKKGERPMPDNIIEKLVKALEKCDMEVTSTDWDYKKCDEYAK